VFDVGNGEPLTSNVEGEDIVYSARRLVDAHNGAGNLVTWVVEYKEKIS
tara:strand:+ start:19926 stop:20072 length:147 start_codon:yes stop_codon:yes gene_type:complete